MKLLLNGCYIVAIAAKIESGFYHESDVRKWYIDDNWYALYDNFTVKDIGDKYPNDLPQNTNKYLYVEEQFMNNPEYIEPKQTINIEQLRADINYLLLLQEV